MSCFFMFLVKESISILSDCQECHSLQAELLKLQDDIVRFSFFPPCDKRPASTRTGRRQGASK